MPRRWRVLLGLLLLVLWLHALLLGLLPFGVGGGWRGDVKHPLQVRQIVLPAPEPVPQPAPPPPVAEAPPPPAAVARAASQPELPVPAPAPELAAPEPLAAPELPPSAAAPLAALPPLSAAEGGGQTLPVYPTRLPPAALLRYDLKRGALGGTGELAWRPADGRYQLSMEGTAFGLNVIGWVSQGGFDAAGIAPERFVDRRRGRDLRAANFQRDKGRITFSGPQVEYPLVAGAQDRLSWMLQLPAIVEAEPAKFVPGVRIAMFVVGARGDGDVWTFSVEAMEGLELPAGRVEGALRLRREPRKPYDTLVEVWLDPARSHLPVRVRMSVPQTDDAYEFLLREFQSL